MTESGTEASTAASFSQREKTELRRLEFDHTLIVSVDVGFKTVRHLKAEIEASAGDLVVIPGRHVVDIVNAPDPHSVGAIYRASILSLSAESLGRTGAMEPSYAAMNEPRVIRSPSDELTGAFLRAHDAVARQDLLPRSIVQNRTMEVVLWIEEIVGRRLCASDLQAISFSRKLRMILNENLSAKWAAPEVAKRLAVSDATLRRRLRAEQTSFAGQLLEARLMRALELLQSSNLSIGTIAAEVGYESPSRFAERFRDRFGAAPSVFRAEGLN